MSEYKELEGYTIFGGYSVTFKSKAQFDRLVAIAEDVPKYKPSLYTSHLIYKTFGLTILDTDKLSEDKVRELERYVKRMDNAEGSRLIK